MYIDRLKTRLAHSYIVLVPVHAKHEKRLIIMQTTCQNSNIYTSTLEGLRQNGLTHEKSELFSISSYVYKLYEEIGMTQTS